MEFLSLVPYLMSFSLVSCTFDLKGMFLLVVRYQLLSVSLDWQMALMAADNICHQVTLQLCYDSHVQASAWLIVPLFLIVKPFSLV